MDLNEKIKILSDSAKYDVSCSSSGSSRKNKKTRDSGAVEGACQQRIEPLRSWREIGERGSCGAHGLCAVSIDCTQLG